MEHDQPRKPIASGFTASIFAALSFWATLTLLGADIENNIGTYIIALFLFSLLINLYVVPPLIKRGILSK